MTKGILILLLMTILNFYSFKKIIVTKVKEERGVILSARFDNYENVICSISLKPENPLYVMFIVAGNSDEMPSIKY